MRGSRHGCHSNRSRNAGHRRRGGAGKAFSGAFRAATPYPDGPFTDVLPEPLLDRVIKELKSLPEAADNFDRPQERLKTCCLSERLPTYTRQLSYTLNSRPLVRFMQELTGISG